MEELAVRELVAVLRRAHAGELGADIAYQGHARSLADPLEAAQVRAIAREEAEHRRSVRRMLDALGQRPQLWRESLFWLIGSTLGWLCRVSGWVAPMYGAGWLERGNIGQYEDAAGLAIAAGRPDFAPELLRMAGVEWEHELYFRSKVVSRRFPLLPIWPAPPPRESLGPKLPRSFNRRLEATPVGPIRPAS